MGTSKVQKQKVTIRQAKIPALIAEGMGLYDMAEHFGVSDQTIRNDMIALGILIKGIRSEEGLERQRGAACKTRKIMLERRERKNRCEVCGKPADPEGCFRGKKLCQDHLREENGDPDYYAEQRRYYMSGRCGGVSIGSQWLSWCLLFAVFLFLPACEDECEMNDTRCRGEVAQICSSGGEWELFADCSEIEGGEIDWTCCEDETTGDMTCLPAEECAGGEI